MPRNNIHINAVTLVKLFRPVLLTILGTCLFSACSSIQHFTPAATVSATDNLQSQHPYYLGYGDIMVVRFRHVPELNDTLRVRPDGRISLQRIGDIFVNGLTVIELEQKIKEAYSSIILDPDPVLSLQRVYDRMVYVMGRVRRGGRFEIQPDMTLTQAISEAGGSIDGAKMKEVRVLRRDEAGIVKLIVADIRQPDKGRSERLEREDILVHPQDLIYVPTTRTTATVNTINNGFRMVLPLIDTYFTYQIWQQILDEGL